MKINLLKMINLIEFYHCTSLAGHLNGKKMVKASQELFGDIKKVRNYFYESCV